MLNIERMGVLKDSPATTIECVRTCVRACARVCGLRYGDITLTALAAVGTLGDHRLHLNDLCTRPVKLSGWVPCVAGMAAKVSSAGTLTTTRSLMTPRVSNSVEFSSNRSLQMVLWFLRMP